MREIKLGEFGVMTLAEARKTLGRLKLERERGIDPQLQKQQSRAAARRQREAEKLARYTVAKLGDRPAAAVTRRELLEQVIRPVLTRAPRCGTYLLLGRIRCAYTHADDQGRLPDDCVIPTLGIKGAPQVRRKRAFTGAELATFVRWLPVSPYSRAVRDALNLVLYTGCRSGEVVAARWRDIDLERAVWIIRETKNGEPHDDMLCRQAIDLLKSRQELSDIFAFPSPMNGLHIGQKALGLAQYEARRVSTPSSRPVGRANPLSVVPKPSIA